MSNDETSTATAMTKVSTHFDACQFLPQPAVVSSSGSSSSSVQAQDSATVGALNTATPPSSFKISSFYLDSAGKAQISLPLQLCFSSEEALQEVLESGCIQPRPPSSLLSDDGEPKAKDASNNEAGASSTEAKQPREDNTNTVQYNFSVEARVKMTFGSGEAITASVEGVEIESTRIAAANDKETTSKKNCLDVMVLAHVRVARQGDMVTSVAGVKLNLEVVAVLTEKTKTIPNSNNNNTAGESSSSSETPMRLERQALASGLRGLYFGRYNPSAMTMGSSSTEKNAASSSLSSSSSATATASNPNKSTLTNSQNIVTKTRLAPPLMFQVSLDHAMTVEARSMNGPSMGETWIALNIAHSNVHNRPVTITNVTLHPAFSKTQQIPTTTTPQASSASAATIPAASNTTTKTSNKETVLDMSQNLKWRFHQGCGGDRVDGSENKVEHFPKTLRPNEAYSVVLYLLAEDDVMSRTFASPISVTATLANDTATKEESTTSSTRADTDDEGIQIVSIVQGKWTSVLRAHSPSDSFRVDFSLPQTKSVPVGKMFTLSLAVHNLDNERKNLKVGVVSEEDGNSNVGTASSSLFKNPSMDSLLNSDAAALLAVDDSAHLGTVEGCGSGNAELRFIPLRAGTLPLPEFVLMSEEGTNGGDESKVDPPADAATPVYHCPHNLQIVATS